MACNTTGLTVFPEQCRDTISRRRRGNYGNNETVQTRILTETRKPEEVTKCFTTHAVFLLVKPNGRSLFRLYLVTDLNVNYSTKLRVSLNVVEPIREHPNNYSTVVGPVLELNSDQLKKIRDLVHAKTSSQIELVLKNDRTKILNTDVPTLRVNPTGPDSIYNEYTFPFDEMRLVLGYIPNGEQVYRYCATSQNTWGEPWPFGGVKKKCSFEP